MKKFILLISALIAVGSASAQEALSDIKKDIYVSASNLLAYPGPHKKLTPAPKGYKPFYISHYGRHGSRYLCDQNDYDYPYNILKRADSLGRGRLKRSRCSATRHTSALANSHSWEQSSTNR